MGSFSKLKFKKLENIAIIYEFITPVKVSVFFISRMLINMFEEIHVAVIYFDI